MGADIKTKL